MSVVFQRTVSPADGEVAEALAAFSEAASAAHIPDRARRDLLVILDELLANIVMHSGVSSAGSLAQVTVTRRDATLEVEVRDDGPPFDPLAQAEPDTTLSAADRPIGGLGLHLVRQLSDEVHYERHGQQNVLNFIKRMPDTDDANQRGS